VNIGERVRYVMQMRGISLTDMAAKLGIKPSSVHAWGKGGNNPSGKRLAEIADILNVSTDYLLKDFYELLMGACAMRYVAVEDIIREFGLSDDITSGRAMPDLDTIVKISERIRVRANWFTGEPLGKDQGYMLPDHDDKEPGLGHTPALPQHHAKSDEVAAEQTIEIFTTMFEDFSKRIGLKSNVRQEEPDKATRAIKLSLDYLMLVVEQFGKSSVEALCTTVNSTANTILAIVGEKNQRIATLENTLAEKEARISELERDRGV